MPDNVPIKDYVDAATSAMQGQLDRRFETILREIEQRFDDHRDVHEREREVLNALKAELHEYRQVDNGYRAQMTQEHSLYITRSELWAMMAGLGGVILFLMTATYFIIFVVRGGH